MRRMLLLVPLVLFVAATPVASQEKSADGPITLTLVARIDKYMFDGGDPAAYKAMLEATARKLEKGELVAPPRVLPVDLVLKLTNDSKEATTIYVGGDPNVYTFDLTGGAGVVAMRNPVGFTADFRFPKAVTLAPGKSHEIPVKALSDGMRGASRLVFWTGPGKYQLVARYRLSTQDGGKGPELKSAPVEITVAGK